MANATRAGVRLAGAFPEVTEVAATLRRARQTVAVAESCTGGLLGAVLTAVAGASDYMRGGVIAYADPVKSTLLEVPAQLIAERGAVSEEVAVAMARGARNACQADIGIAITGVAGPDGGTPDKPVGLVFVAITDGRAETVERLDGNRDREENRALAVRAALRLCQAAAERADSG
jgi:PncC family amidohydrolase